MILTSRTLLQNATNLQDSLRFSGVRTRIQSLNTQLYTRNKDNLWRRER